jgi:cation:H+ antiporter
MINYFVLIAGLALLLVGGDILVRGAVGLAEKLAIPPLIIGLTIVSFGTSAPELFISVNAALEGAGGLAIGNVVGSNIANVLLVLGIPALIYPCICKEDGIGRNLLVLVGITIVFMGMLSKGSLDFYDGAILFTLLLLYLYSQFRNAAKIRKQLKSTATSDNNIADYHDEIESVPTRVRVIAVLIVFGVIMLPLGADLTVSSASHIARSWNVSDEVIGLTVVAIGTSLPELATTLMAVFRNNSSVALGNVVGSNIFNIAAIMGITAMVAPLPVGGHIVQIDMWVMLATTITIALLAHYGKTIKLSGGLAMSAIYCAYIAFTLAGQHAVGFQQLSGTKLELKPISRFAGDDCSSPTVC